MKFRSLDNRNYTLNISSNDTVLTVKRILAKTIEIDYLDIILFFENKICDDLVPVGQYNIGPDDIVLFDSNEKYKEYNKSLLKSLSFENGQNAFIDEKLIFNIVTGRLITIFISDHNNNYTIRTRSDETVANFKKIVSHRIGNDEKDFKLVYQGITLCLNETLEYYDLQNGSQLILIPAIKGGGNITAVDVSFHSLDYENISFDINCHNFGSIIKYLSEKYDIPSWFFELFLDPQRNHRLTDKDINRSVDQSRKKINAYFSIKPIVGNFNLIEKLGEGAHGVVYKCLDKESKKIYALKKFKISKKNDERIKKFFHEMNVIRALNRHERIVNYELETLETDNAKFIVMEYMPGGSLRSYLKENGCLPEDKIAAYSKQILEGLRHLHGNRVIHGDIKGDNILLDKGHNSIKLCDFGLSIILPKIASADDLNGVLKSFGGTLPWAAPEVVENKSLEFSADVWSFGATLVEMLTAKDPYDDLNSAQIIFQLCVNKELPFSCSGTISETMKSFVDSCLQGDSKKRSTVDQLLGHPFLLTAS